MLTGRPSRDSGKVFPPKRVMVLSVVFIHVAKFGNVQVTEIVLVKLEPGDVASPIRRWHSAAYIIKHSLLTSHASKTCITKITLCDPYVVT